MTASALPNREQAVRRGQRLTWATIAYNTLEAVIAIGAGLLAGSVALVGFGFDSVIELGSSLAGLWRLSADSSLEARGRAEPHAFPVIGWRLPPLAALVCVD